MSEKFERVELDFDLCDSISGGQLQWRNVQKAGRYKVYSDENPDVVYGVSYANIMEAKRLAQTRYANLPDSEALAALLADGLIFPL